MNYENKYKEALERARKLYEQGTITESLCYVFSELAESEDEKIRKELITHCRNTRCVTEEGAKEIVRWIAWLEKQGVPQDKGEISDGYHTFNELYYYRMLYNAAFFNMLPKEWVHKSKKHHDGEDCFGGGWFIVMANLPTGQISNHYELKDWDLFQIPEKEVADKWDGHTPQEAADRLHKYLLEKQDKQPSAIRWYDVSLIPQEMEELLVEWDSEDATWHEIAFYHADTKTFWNGTRQVENVTRWCYITDLLEKQGEQKPAVEMKTPEESLGIDSDTYNKIVDECIYEYEKDRADAIAEMQKPWSEEDENRINRLIAYFEDKESFTAEDDIVYANWLKSIRPQNRWKPNDEQIIALRWVLNNVPYNKHKEEISGLLEQLKKLKG